MRRGISVPDGVSPGAAESTKALITLPSLKRYTQNVPGTKSYRVSKRSMEEVVFVRDRNQNVTGTNPYRVPKRTGYQNVPGTKTWRGRQRLIGVLTRGRGVFSAAGVVASAAACLCLRDNSVVYSFRGTRVGETSTINRECSTINRTGPKPSAWGAMDTGIRRFRGFHFCEEGFLFRGMEMSPDVVSTERSARLGQSLSVCVSSF